MTPRHLTTLLSLAALLGAAAPARAAEDVGGDLDAVLRRGVLRHVGVPYANFVTGSGDGLDVELVTLFAKKLGVRYEYVKSDWGTALPDLVGKAVSSKVGLEQAPAVPIRGDLLANGVTVLPWREKAVAFSAPYFPTQVWVMARADSPVKPIKPTGNVDKDIEAVRALLSQRQLLSVPGTCLEPSLYRLEPTGAKVVILKVELNEVAPALLKGDGELSLLDVADAMIALEKWPGKMKVIGPISPPQEMAVAFRKDSPRLRAAFDAFLAEARRDGTYDRLVAKYFPEVHLYFPKAFSTVGVKGP